MSSCKSEADIMKHKQPIGNVVLIENAIDVGIPEKREKNSKKLTIGTTGRIKAQKDPMALANWLRNWIARMFRLFG